MKKWLLLFTLISFTSGCAWYDHHTHHDNGRHCGKHGHHCDKDKHRDHHDDDHHDNGHHHKGKKGKKHHD